MALVYKQLTLEKPNLIMNGVSIARLCFINGAEPVVRVPTTTAAYGTKARRSLHHELHTSSTDSTSSLLSTLLKSLNSHIEAKRQQLNLRVKKHYWLIGQTSQLSAENKLLLYKTTLKPIRTDGVELWGCSKQSNTKTLQAFQSKTLRLITNAPRYANNQTLHTDLSIPYLLTYSMVQSPS